LDLYLDGLDGNQINRLNFRPIELDNEPIYPTFC